MAIPSRQIGWGTEENLLWEISKQLEYLNGVAYKARSIVPLIYTSQVPAHSYGEEGNVKNNFTYDSNYFYICTADFQGAAINIWKRIAWTAGTW
jgi:hypothetical protein